MILEPLPKEQSYKFDKDSLIYCSDDAFYYGEEVDKKLVEDIKNHNFQIYNGYYHYKKGWNSPKLYYTGRGRTCGKVKIKIQNFHPYCYVDDDNGNYKTYLGKPVEKVILKGQHPRNIKRLREHYRKKHIPLPYESDIRFPVRFLIDTYDYFKSTEVVKPKVCILDIENNHPISEDLIAYSINDQEGPIVYRSKYDDMLPSELALDIHERLQKFDVVTGWNVNFDIDELHSPDRKKLGPLDKIDKHLDYARKGKEYPLDKYIEMMAKGNRYFNTEEETKRVISKLIELDYLTINNNKVVLGNKEFNPNPYEYIAVVDMLGKGKKASIVKKMHSKEIRGRWSLDNTGVKLCGIGKVHIGATRIGDLDEQSLMEYNVRDVIIPEIIDNKLGGLETHAILSWSLQSTINDVIITAVVNDIALLRAYHKQKLVLNTREYSKGNSDEPNYNAAEPVAIPGVYEGLVVLDLCLSDDTEVLTPNGWKTYKTLNIGDDVYSFNKNKKCIENDKVLHKVEYEYDGDLIHFDGRNISQLLTPNHLTLYQEHYRYKNNNKYNTWSEYKEDISKNIKQNTRIPLIYPIDRNIQYNISNGIISLIGWVITEGHKPKDCKGLYISQDERKYKLIKKCLDEEQIDYSLKYRKDKKYYSFYIKSHENFRKYFDKDDVHLIPMWMLQKLSNEQLEILYTSIIEGDGHKYSDTYHTFRCYREDNIERFLHLCSLLGYVAQKSKRGTDVYITIPKNSKRISEDGRRHSKLMKSNIKKQKYNGIVWCPTTNNGFIVIKHNNKISITGNCHAYPSAVISKNISAESKDPNGNHKTPPTVLYPNGVRYNDTHSVFIDTLKEIMEERGKVKKIMNSHKKHSRMWKYYKSIDFCLKTQAAAFSHGLFGWADSRMRDYEIADSITAVVRETVNLLKNGCEKVSIVWCYAHSVTPDTSLLLKNIHSGWITIKNIEDLENNYLDYFVWTENGWKSINKFIKHKSVNNLYRVNTRNGLVNVTDCHSLLDSNGKEVKVTNLEIGDKLLHHKYNKERICEDILLTRDKAWLYGYFIAEGSCGYYKCKSGNKYSWAINNKNIKELEYCGKILNKEFNLDYKIDNTLESSNVYKLRLDCHNKKSKNNFTTKDMVKLFRDLCYYGNEKKIPDEVLNSNNEIIKSFLDGYNAGDGSHNNKYSKRYHSFKTKSNILAHGLTILLNKINLDYTIRITSNGKVKKYYQIYVVTDNTHYKLNNSNKIKLIEPIDNVYDYVYDLETDNHHFQAGIGDMIVHNTDSIYVNITKDKVKQVLNYLNNLIEEEFKGDPLIPVLEEKGYYPYAYIHSPARNVLVREGVDIDNHDDWDVTGMNFMRSETPEPLGDIEVELIKLKMKGSNEEELINKMKEMILDLPNKDTSLLGLGKPLNKPIKEYGKTLQDGSHGNIPFHITAYLKAKEEYGFDVPIGSKFLIIPILTDETYGVRKIRRKKVEIAYSMEEGLPKQYKIDWEYYLKSNLFGKIHNLFGCKPKELLDIVLTDDVKRSLGVPLDVSKKED